MTYTRMLNVNVLYKLTHTHTQWNNDDFHLMILWFYVHNDDDKIDQAKPDSDRNESININDGQNYPINQMNHDETIFDNKILDQLILEDDIDENFDRLYWIIILMVDLNITNQTHLKHNWK